MAKLISFLDLLVFLMGYILSRKGYLGFILRIYLFIFAKFVLRIMYQIVPLFHDTHTSLDRNMELLLLIFFISSTKLEVQVFLFPLV